MTVDERGRDILSVSVREFIEAVAERKPTPGGGSVAGVVGALAAALGEMALNFTRGKKQFAEHEELHERIARRLGRARRMFEDLVTDDVQAYELYREASRMADGTDKQEAIQLALAAAIDVPREMAKLALAVLHDLSSLADKCNPYLISDVTAGAALGAAVTRLCDYNVRVNTPQLDDRQAARDIRDASRGDLEAAEKSLREIERTAQQDD